MTGKFTTMLILTRRVGENLRIGEEVSVVVLEVNASGTPWDNGTKSVTVHREEVFERMRKKSERRNAERCSTPSRQRKSLVEETGAQALRN